MQLIYNSIQLIVGNCDSNLLFEIIFRTMSIFSEKWEEVSGRIKL